MVEKAGEYNVMRTLLDGIMGGATSSEAAGQDQAQAASITVNGGTVVIGDGNHIHAKAEAERITDAQSRLLKALVRKIGKAERAKNPAYSDARTWTKANAVAGVDCHRDILKRDLDKVLDYLEDWLGRLDSPSS